MSKTLIDVKPAWAIQEEAFRSNLPFNENTIKKAHNFDRNSMATVFPFFSSEVGHEMVFQLDLISKQDYQYCLITLVLHLQTIT